MDPSSPVWSSQRILVLDDDDIVLIAMADSLRQLGCPIDTFNKPDRALDALERSDYAVIISDQRMAGLTGLDFLNHAARTQPDASRILITGVLNLEVVIDAINRGEIYRFLAKPWIREELLTTVRNALERHQLLAHQRRLLQSTQELNEQLTTQNRELHGQLNAENQERCELAEARAALADNFHHALNLSERLLSTFHPMLGNELRQVQDLARKLAKAMKLSLRERQILLLAARTYSLGLLGISRETLLQARRDPESLSDGERHQIETHPVYSQSLANFIGDLAEVGPIVRACRERWDGSGYPDHLAGALIPGLARNLAVIIAYVESGLPRDEAIEQLLADSGQGFEPEAVRRLVRLVQRLQPSDRRRQVLFSELEPGMRLAGAIHSPAGLLLLPEGTVLTEPILNRLRQHEAHEPTQELLQVYLDTPASETSACPDALGN